jgi:transcriptional regulator with XRE-family HTH domain
MIYRARPEFPQLLETAGLTQSEVARRAEMSRHYLSHVAARRRNISGAFAARIAVIYGEEKGVSQEDATDRLFEVVAEKKNSGTPRLRGERGRFVKGEPREE